MSAGETPGRRPPASGDQLESFFRFVNLYPLPLWLAMMVAPNHRLTQRAARSGVIFALAAVNYVLALAAGLRPGGEGDQGFPDFTTLGGVGDALGTRPGALGAWSHMLALDLFTGAWIYRRCQELGAPAWVRVPVLLFTLLAGPFGLLLFLIWRFLAPQRRQAPFE